MRTLRVLCLLALVAVVATPALVAQSTTTGQISGKVVDMEGTALPGVTITATHEPTSTRYVVVTRQDGRFTIPNARVGGPYTVVAELDAFRPEVAQDVSVRLGDAVELQYQLAPEEFGEELTVIGESFISASRMGATSNVSQRELETLPSIARGFEDFARTNPLFTDANEGDATQGISVAGRNNRYNNIQIDGAVNNDLFGLADSGTPGGQTETNPISLDAIKEIQLIVSPYDVRQGGFSGGGINAITRSGTNAYNGSVYGYYRDNDYVGDGPDVLGEFGQFEESNYGFRLGGPLREDKVFFFVNADIGRKDTPTGFSIDGSTGQAFGGGALLDEAMEFRNFLMDNYGYDPGGFSELSRNTDSDKAFARLDFNLSDAHQLTLRHNYVDAENLVNFPGRFTYEFDSEAYLITDETNSTVAQLNSVFSNTMFNELRVTFQTIKDRRGGRQQPFPWIEIEDVAGTGLEFEAGTEPFSTRNALDQDILELTNDFTWIQGDHTIILGTHNELFEFDNLFIQNAFGAYEFETLDDFFNGVVDEFEYTLVNPGQEDSQKFEVNQIGLYAGDRWTVRPNLTLVYGLRVDIPYFPDEPSRNPFTEATFGLRTDSIPDGNELWSPRLGFNWDPTGDGRQQLRGGAGIFAGRTPYVWISNNYARTGIEQTFIRVFDPPIGFNPDPFNQPSNVGGASIGEFNLIDPDFEFPQVARYTLAYDRQLPWWGLRGTVEGIFSDSLEEIDYRNVNLAQTGVVPIDGRPFYGGRVDPGVSGAFFITNTSEGEQTNVVVKVEKPYSNGFWGYISYVYGDSEVVNEGTSSRAVSNWQFNEAADPNNAPLSTSDFVVEHRFNLAASYEFNRDSDWSTTVSTFYNHQSGRPYGFIYGFQQFPSWNGDAFFGNDLIYVPASQDEVIVVGGTWADLDAFIRADDCLSEHRGEIAPRNCATAPWYHQLDLSLAQNIPLFRTDLQVTLDVFNVMNIFDEDSGLLRYANFNTLSPVDFLGFDAATGKPVYGLDQILIDPEEEKFEIHNDRSRWAAKVGVRVSF